MQIKRNAKSLKRKIAQYLRRSVKNDNNHTFCGNTNRITINKHRIKQSFVIRSSPLSSWSSFSVKYNASKQNCAYTRESKPNEIFFRFLKSTFHEHRLHTSLADFLKNEKEKRNCIFCFESSYFFFCPRIL